MNKDILYAIFSFVAGQAFGLILIWVSPESSLWFRLLFSVPFAFFSGVVAGFYFVKYMKGKK